MHWDRPGALGSRRRRAMASGQSRHCNPPTIELELDLLDDERLLIARLALRVMLHDADGALRVLQIENATEERRRPWKDLAEQCPALHRRAVEQLESDPDGQELLRKTLQRDASRF